MARGRDGLVLWLEVGWVGAVARGRDGLVLWLGVGMGWCCG